MKARLYLETTVPSYLTARPTRDLIRASHQQITQEWWEYRRKDFDVFISQLVLDEAAGMCMTMLFLPIWPGGCEAWVIFGAFVAFRVFDISKPPPCKRLENLPGGWGILMDDLAAAIYANIVCQIVFRWIVH